MGSSNPMQNSWQKTSAGLADVNDSLGNDPGDTVANAINLSLSGKGLIKRIIKDKKDQAMGQADAAQADAAAAQARADNAAPSALDPMVEERRRRAQIARVNGRNSTILTNPNSLGTSDIARKVLLGL